ncbi:MAG: MFS transporter [Coxiella sp. RIFCSPHIGHO2_12_FULL_42_15]|nr:MAG: MFS transporter [Coxiella sp. RIFCSPHIGHO2_12_FULL_42_15]
MRTEASTTDTELNLSRPTYRYYPWLIVLLSAMFLFYKYIMQVSPSIMTYQLMRDFKIDGVGLGNLAATFFYTYFITQLFVGVLLDKISPRFLSGAAILTSALGTYFFSFADSIVFACLARGLMGFGAAFATVSYMKLTANWFKPHQFAFIGGLLATAAMLGAAFGQAPLAWLVNQTGWRHGLVICAWFGISIALLFFVIVRDHPKTEQFLCSKKEQSYVAWHDIVKIFQNKQNWLLTAYNGLAFTPVIVFGGLWGNPFLMQAYHLSETKTATVVSMVFFGLALGGPALGFLSDRLQVRRQVMITGAFLALITATLVIYLNIFPTWIVGCLLFLFGFGTGAFMLGFAIGKEINPIAVSATIIALINTGDGVFGSFTEPLIGKFLDLGWDGRIVNGVHHFSVSNYHHAFIILPIYLLAAIVTVFYIKENTQRR